MPANTLAKPRTAQPLRRRRTPSRYGRYGYAAACCQNRRVREKAAVARREERQRQAIVKVTAKRARQRRQQRSHASSACAANAPQAVAAASAVTAGICRHASAIRRCRLHARSRFSRPRCRRPRRPRMPWRPFDDHMKIADAILSPATTPAGPRHARPRDIPRHAASPRVAAARVFAEIGGTAWGRRSGVVRGCTSRRSEMQAVVRSCWRQRKGAASACGRRRCAGGGRCAARAVAAAACPARQADSGVRSSAALVRLKMRCSARGGSGASVRRSARRSRASQAVPPAPAGVRAGRPPATRRQHARASAGRRRQAQRVPLKNGVERQAAEPAEKGMRAPEAQAPCSSALRFRLPYRGARHSAWRYGFISAFVSRRLLAAAFMAPLPSAPPRFSVLHAASFFLACRAAPAGARRMLHQRCARPSRQRQPWMHAPIAIRQLKMRAQMVQAETHAVPQRCPAAARRVAGIAARLPDICQPPTVQGDR